MTEIELILRLLLGLRKSGIKEISDGNKLHLAFSKLLELEKTRIESILGNLPRSHALFGTFDSVDEAISDGLRFGLFSLLAPELKTYVYDISIESAEKLLNDVNVDIFILINQFCLLCQPFTRR